jgi:hypothetical protein
MVHFRFASVIFLPEGGGTMTRIGRLLAGLALAGLIVGVPALEVLADGEASHVKETIRHAKEGIAHEKEAIKHLEESIKASGDAHAKEALEHAKEAVKHAEESLGHAEQAVNHQKGKGK